MHSAISSSRLVLSAGDDDELLVGLTRAEDDVTKDLYLIASNGARFKVHQQLVLREWPGLSDLPRKKCLNGIDGQMEEVKTKIRSDLLDLIIEYCYFTDIDLRRWSFTVIEQLIELLKQLKIDGLIDRVICGLVKNLSVDNCLTLWKLSKKTSFKHSFMVHDYVLYNLFEGVAESLGLLYDFYRLRFEEVLLILNDSYLNVRSEKDVWFLADLWMRVDRPGRVKRAPEFCKLLRFQNKFDAVNFFAEESSDLLPRSFLRDNVFGVLAPRVPRDLIVVIGGFRDNRLANLSAVEVYDKRTREWRLCNQLPDVHNNSHALVYVESKAGDRIGNPDVVVKSIYVIGGRGGKCFTSALSPPKSPTFASVWEERAPMYKSRSFASACVSDSTGLIYVLGGLFHEDVLGAAECYNPMTNQWKKLPQMPSPRSGAAAVALGGKIYVVGGTDGRLVLSSVVVYDEETNVWSELSHSSMSIPRKNHCVVAWGGGILVAGGLCPIPVADMHEEFMAQNSVEFFEPVKQTWKALPSMDYARFHFAMVVMHDDVFSIGGQIDFENSINAVEKFDGHQWVIDSFLRDARGHQKACVLTNWWPASDWLLGEPGCSRPIEIDLNEYPTIIATEDNCTVGVTTAIEEPVSEATITKLSAVTAICDE